METEQTHFQSVACQFRGVKTGQHLETESTFAVFVVPIEPNKGTVIDCYCAVQKVVTVRYGQIVFLTSANLELSGSWKPNQPAATYKTTFRKIAPR
jgi:hypothetical protein